jgi:hypothetical protein
MITKQKVQQMARRFFDEHYKKQIKPGSISQQKPKDYIVMSTFDEQIREAASKHVDLKRWRSASGAALLDYAYADFIAGANHAKALLDKRVEETIRSLQVLRNEVRGTLSAHEIAIRYDSGNSNWECLEIALKQAEEALEAWHKG